MRDILFRGKAANREDYRVYRTTYKNGDWVYGLLTDRENYLGYAEMTNEGGVQCIEVDKDTIGQYIGLTDKNGKKIFEGDVVKLFLVDDTEIGVIKFSDIKCRFMYYDGEGYYSFDNTCKFEVIGNIHDNPELLNN